MSARKNSRPGKASTPAVLFGALLLALGLTAASDSQARAPAGELRGFARVDTSYDAGELRVLDWTLFNVAKYYVEPERIDPLKMAIAGLEGLEQAIPQVLVEPLGDIEKPGRVRVRVGTHEKEFKVGDVVAVWTVGKRLREVFRFVREHAELDDDGLRAAEYAIVEGVLGTLDPHSNLLRPEDFEQMRTSTKGSFGGLGIEVGMRDAKITVIRVIDGTPADKVGMKSGDRIVQIDEESTVTMNLSEAVDRLRGAPGTTVTVWVRREGSDKPKKLLITRDKITLDSVIGTVLPAEDAKGNPIKVGLLQLNRNFSQTTGKEVRDKLKEFEEAGVRGVVLDMRDNPGGLLTAGVEVADAFLSSGTIVSTVGPSSPRDELRADTRYDFPDLPLVVLIDQGSASATEIVAGALRNLGRAVLIGRRSFGKGSVQVLNDRKVGDKELALKLTIAQYLTPGDISIQSVGVSPDLETVPVYIGEEYVAYHGRKRFDLVREEALASRLESEKIDRAQKIAAGPLHFLSYGSITPETKGKKKKTDEPRRRPLTDDESDAETALEDPEIRIARDLVAWAPTSSREGILSGLGDFLAKKSAEEAELIARSIGARGIDWEPGARPEAGKKAELLVRVSTDKPGNVIRGGESGTLTMTVTNNGDAPAYQVRAISDSDYSYLDERELLLGKIEPGETKSATLKLSIAEHEHSRTDELAFDVTERYGAAVLSGSKTALKVSAEGLPRPQFAYGYQVIDDPSVDKKIQGNGDGALQLGERVRLRVHVTNIGEGAALSTWVNLRNLAGDALFLHTGRENIKELAPGDSAVVNLDFEVRKNPEKGKAALQLSVADTKVGVTLSDKLTFPLAEGSLEFSKARGAVTASAPVELFASPLGAPRVVAEAASGATMRLLGEAEGGWQRVQIAPGYVAFAKSDALQKTGRAGAKATEVTDVLAVSPPTITLGDQVTQVSGDSVKISGVAKDQQAVRDVFITVRNPSRNLFGRNEKVFYKAAENPRSGELAFDAEIPLTPGNNLIEIRARESDDVVATRQMWVLRTDGLSEARLAEAKVNGGGKLSVDTFQH
ncbi:MAG: PDZ domain-containing protein [Myxococcales bacterium]|nr:PDZ domain-containing protein [Myxococcales bacterium]